MLRNMIVSAFFALASSVAFANYVGSETQYFNPTPDNMDFFTVHSSRTLPKGTLKTTLFFDYAENIHYSTPALENNVLQAQLGFAMGLTDRMSFSVAGSGIVNYDDHAGGQYTTDDITHVRTSLKYRFCGCDNGGMALIANLGFGLMDPDYFVGDANDFGASLTLAYDKALSDKVRFGANLGYRYRNADSTMTAAPSPAYAAVTGVERDGSDVLASLGLNYAFNRKWTGVSELYMTLPVDQFFDFTTDTNTFDQKGAEVLLAANYSLTDRMDLGFGAAVGVFSEAQNADWRAFMGMGFAFGGEAEDAAFNTNGISSAPTAAAAGAAAAAAAAKKVADKVKIEDAPVLKEVNMTARFPSGSSTLSQKAKNQLNAVGEFIKSKDYRMVFVEGHTDSQGKEEFNQKLSERRAQMVKIHLMKTYNIPATKIQSVGFGETAPVADNATAEGRAKNRRVTIKVK